MFLKRIAIRAYRSISRADLRLGEITVIIGPSDSGKSNLVRAIRDWAYGTRSEDMISVGATVARVALAFGATDRLVWERLSRTNGNRSTGAKRDGAEPPEPGTGGGNFRYVHADSRREKPMSYEKIGHSVPNELIELTGFRRLKIDDDLSLPLNVVEQKDPWFLLVSPPWTPAKTTKVIGVISGVDALILGNRDIVLAEARTRKDIKQYTAAAEVARAELAQFSGLDAAQVLLTRAAEKMQAARDKRAKLQAAAPMLRSIAALREKLASRRAREAPTRAAIDRAAELDIVGRLESLDRAQALQGTAAITLSRLDAVGQRIIALKQNEAALVKALAEAADADGVCPHCGGPVHEECKAVLRAQAAAEAPPAPPLPIKPLQKRKGKA